MISADKAHEVAMLAAQTAAANGKDIGVAYLETYKTLLNLGVSNAPMGTSAWAAWVKKSQE